MLVKNGLNIRIQHIINVGLGVYIAHDRLALSLLLFEFRNVFEKKVRLH